jgi:guanylate kinase
VRRGVILYGPPASGKDTIDAALRDLSGEYTHFQRLKLGPGRTTGYRLATQEQLHDLRARGLVLWENDRYGATYVVDAPGLEKALDAGVPILHLGQAVGVDVVKSRTTGVNWTVAELWCPRSVAAARLSARSGTDMEERLVAWDATVRLDRADVRIDTNAVEPHDAASRIDSASRTPNGH